MGLLSFKESQSTLLSTQYEFLGTIGSSRSPFITQGVLNLVNFYPAVLSKKKVMSGWSCRKVEGILGLLGYPSIVYFTMSALASPQAIIIIFLAFLIVSIPILIAHLGTF